VREVYRKYPSYGYIVRQSASFDNDSYTRISKIIFFLFFYLINHFVLLGYGETKRR